MEFLAERVAEKSGGRMRIDLYPNRQLGSERELLELLQIGSVGIAKTTTMVLEGFSPLYQVYSMPYLFRDEAHFHSVLEGEIGRQLLLECEKFWLRGLCYYDSGSRSFYTKDRPVRSPEDLAGMKIRTPESPTALKTVNLLGGSATPIAWGELYSALQQGVVDGAENNPPTLLTSHQYEVIKYYTLDEHLTVPDILAVSTHVWKRLNPEEKQWLQEAADESYDYQKMIWKQASVDALLELEKAGIEIIIPDKAPFRRRVLPLYEEYKNQPEVFALIEQIRNSP
jgi:tripartite ATP-independent transporter DctP family solute receptor